MTRYKIEIMKAVNAVDSYAEFNNSDEPNKNLRDFIETIPPEVRSMEALIKHTEAVMFPE